MRLTILSSVSVLALLGLAPVQAYSAFEFVAPKATSAPQATVKETTTITESQTIAPAVPAPVVESSHLPMPTTKETASDLVRSATNPALSSAATSPDFGSQAVPLTPVVRESDALVIDTRVPSNTIRAHVQDLPPLPPVTQPPLRKNDVAALPAPVMPEPAPRMAAAPSSIPTPVMPSNPYDVDVPVSSFGVVPEMRETIPVASARAMDEGKVVQGFGRDVPLVLALQQIVPPSYRYSFDDGISPGMRISWSGDRPWKEIIMEIAQHNNMNVDIVSNVVAFHRGNAATAPMPTPFTETRVTDVAMRETVDYAPAMPAPVLPASARASEPVPVLPPVVRTQPAAPVETTRVASVSKTTTITPAKPAVKSDAFDPLLGDDVPARAKVENKKILTADASTAVKAVDDVAPVASESFAPPMPIAPVMQAEAQPVVSDVPRSSSRNLVPPAEPAIATAPDYVTTDMTSSREWQAFKGETMRQALTAWSNNAGVSLVWSSEFDYPLQTDVRIASSYTDAVRTLLAGFSKAQPRPVGRLFDNKKAGAQPVLIVETQRLTD